jgi:hypothetical protein
MKYKLGSNQHIKTEKVSVKSEFKRIMKESLKVVMVLSFVAGSIVGTYALGSASTSAQVVYASVPTPVSTMPDLPILDRIGDCESGQRNKEGKPIAGTATQFAKDGQVILNANSNHTVDIGKYMINNNVWGETATKMGDDLMTEQGNTNFAIWLFTNKGDSAWEDSSSCWSN